MDNTAFFNTDLFKWVILPVLIFLARVCDVTLGTLRLISITRGRKCLAVFVSFFEILIWLIAMTQIMQHLTNVFYYLAFAGEFATGTFVGMCLEEKLAMGVLLVRIIPQKNSTQLINFLKSANYGVTSVNAQGGTGPVQIIHTIIKRKDLHEVLGIIERFNPNAFFTVEDVKSMSEGGVFPRRSPRLFRFFGKGSD
ncbi:MAG: DUF2179 domain-containing protein [Nitrospirota bacterium]